LKQILSCGGKIGKMHLTFFDYEIPVLKALVKIGGSAKTKDVYPVVEEIMIPRLKNHPEEYGKYTAQEHTIWKNKTQWAREYLKRKGQLDGSIRGVWAITDSGRERLRILEKSGKDPDEGKATIEGIDASLAETTESPEKVFRRIDNLQEHGDILGIRGIVYEPINEQGVVLLFAAICFELGFRIEGIRTGFPDALLIRQNTKGNFIKCLAEFEYKSSNFQLHKHPINGCDLIICWINDWADCPLEVIELKSLVKNIK
jgi:hypothetical protein